LKRLTSLCLCLALLVGGASLPSAVFGGYVASLSFVVPAFANLDLDNVAVDTAPACTLAGIVITGLVAI